jgi:hypothetical protein
MEETFERVTERHGGEQIPVKHLYRRQYQTAGGEWRTIFYAIFTDWQGKRRKFPLGANLDDARDELGRLRTLNKGAMIGTPRKRKRRINGAVLAVGEHLLRPRS